MKKTIFLLCLFACMLFNATCMAGLKDIPAIAVLDFSNHASVKTSADGVQGEISLTDARVASDYVRDVLVETDRFKVMEREVLQAILAEHHLSLTGLVSPDTASQIGQLTGVQYLVYGSVTGCSLKENEFGYDNATIGGATNNQHKVIANVAARFIEVNTGRIVLTGRGKGASTSTGTNIVLRKHTDATTDEYGNEVTAESTTDEHTIKFGAKQVSQEQVHNAIEKAADDVVFGKSGFLAKLDGKGRRRK